VVEFSPSRSHLEDTIDELGFRLYSSIFDKFGIECTKIHMNSEGKVDVELALMAVNKYLRPSA
jgi:hypothetical protein